MLNELRGKAEDMWHYPSQISLAPGESQVIKLEENLSTGYGWQLTIDGGNTAGVFEIVDEGSPEPAARQGGRPMLGAPKTHHYRIVAGSAGDSSFTASYLRPWEPAPIYKVQFSVNVDS